MTDLLLPSLEITNFRALRHLQIERLARVNLIVGKNNVGKTSLLEALWIYARRGAPGSVWDVLTLRDESAVRSAFADSLPSIHALRNMFSDRPDVLTSGGVFAVGSPDAPTAQVQVAVERHPDTSSHQRGEIPYFVLRIGGDNQLFAPLTPGTPDISWLANVPQLAHTVVSANGFSPDYVTTLWDRIALTDVESQIITALQIIDANIERINLVVDPNIGPQRIPIARARGETQPRALRSYGHGMYRMFGIALALVNTKDGLLLIDEIENGLHYSVLPEMWRLIFAVASRLNVQVFATTHSWDCIEAFQIAASADPAEGQIIRLGQAENEISATVFDEEELALIARDQIEVR